MRRKFTCLLLCVLLTCAVTGCKETKQESAAAVSDTVETEKIIKEEKTTEQEEQQEEPADPFVRWLYAQYGETAAQPLEEMYTADVTEDPAWYERTGNTFHVLKAMYERDTGIETDEQIYWKECADEKETVLLFTGDFNFAEGWSTTKHMDAQPNGIYDCFSEELLRTMQEADITMVNNEFVYSSRGEPLSGKAYTFRAKPERVKLLEAFGTDIVGLANNHVWDYGEEALLDTFAALEEEGIPYVGAGRNIQEAQEIIYFIANGRKIAITAATQIERTLDYTKEATEERAGVLKTLDPAKYKEVIRRAKENSDIVIAYVHWGTEKAPWYGADQTALAEAFAEAGADAVVGAHTHCLQGISYVSGVPVAYSLGNFWFTESAIDTGVLEVVIKEDGEPVFCFLPCRQQNLKTSLVTEEAEKQRILSYVESLSTNIKIDEQGYVSDVSGTAETPE